ncbi:hypothetical protein JANAI62_33690 [Jannaschia pagri]|uniref:NADH-quinone oxidoreductase subunit E n=1 Tax=Jannaschia pagri TaxID=2829797 RepID=A0ABQ4NQS6_9RHOB|nr:MULTISPECIES: hypothetical protein [unclassified Jannaschia]GIT92911.1 hypothetical protein JANAI61_33690 [Jannaschia sp. AI_61]GIT96746.1 hypothetical protein JANAI62_33690 [Jannaschia sp. AI_62]
MDKKIQSIGPMESAATIFVVAGMAGVASFALLMLIGGWTFLQAFFGGFVVFVLLLILLMLTVGRAVPSEASTGTKMAPPQPGPVGAEVDLTKLRPRDVNGASPTRDSIEPMQVSDTSSGPRFAGADERSATVGLVGAGATTRSAEPAPMAAPVEPIPPVETVAPAAAPAVAEPAVEAAPEPAAPEPAAPEPTPVAETPAPTPEPAPAAAAAPQEAGTKPQALDGPREGGADDLKRIKGIGPKLEKLCHSLGFYHFDQIAAWTADEVAWVDQNLEGFKGRVTRDAWVAQATQLASGEETDFSKKVDKGGVY